MSETREEMITNVLVDPAGAVAEIQRLREALEIVEDQDGRVDILELAAELRDLRVEVSHLRWMNGRLLRDMKPKPHYPEAFEGGQRLCPEGRDDCECLDVEGR